jgi:hypothetical protein
MLGNLLVPSASSSLPDLGRPFYRAVTTLDAFALIEEPLPRSWIEDLNDFSWLRR